MPTEHEVCALEQRVLLGSWVNIGYFPVRRSNERALQSSTVPTERPSLPTLSNDDCFHEVRGISNVTSPSARNRALSTWKGFYAGIKTPHPGGAQAVCCRPYWSLHTCRMQVLVCAFALHGQMRPNPARTYDWTSTRGWRRVFGCERLGRTCVLLLFRR
jgi:hypothetical protein